MEKQVQLHSTEQTNAHALDWCCHVLLAGAIMHGQFSCAQECLESAGEWETAMALAVCAGDFGALRSMAAGLQVTTAPGRHACVLAISTSALVGLPSAHVAIAVSQDCSHHC